MHTLTPVLGLPPTTQAATPQVAAQGAAADRSRFTQATGLPVPKVNDKEFPVQLGFTKTNEIIVGRLAMLGKAVHEHGGPGRAGARMHAFNLLGPKLDAGVSTVGCIKRLDLSDDLPHTSPTRLHAGFAAALIGELITGRAGINS